MSTSDLHTVSLRREYAATPAALFAAWTDIELLRQWFGCADDQLWTVHAWQPQPGGAIHVSMEFDDQRYEVRGRFTIVDEPHRIAYDWEHGQTISVDIEAIDATNSAMTVTHTGLPDQSMVDVVTGGWTNSMSQIRTAL